jgi:hypothetical protein
MRRNRGVCAREVEGDVESFPPLTPLPPCLTGLPPRGCPQLLRSAARAPPWSCATTGGPGRHAQGNLISRYDPDQGARRPRLGGGAATGRRADRLAGPAHQARGGVAKRGHHLRDPATPHVGPTVIARHLVDPMALGRDLPRLTNQAQPLPRTRPLWAKAGAPRDHAVALCPTRLAGDVALDVDDLGQPRPVTVPHRYWAGGQVARLDASVPAVDRLAGRHSAPRRQWRGHSGRPTAWRRTSMPAERSWNGACPVQGAGPETHVSWRRGSGWGMP